MQMRRPAPGDRLVLDDGRSCELTETSAAAGSWWFKARTQDGCSLLEGNLFLEWHEDVEAWFPAVALDPLLPRSLSQRARHQRRAHRRSESDR